MGTMVKMYIHVLLVDINESPLFIKCESDFINKTKKNVQMRCLFQT